MVGNFAWGSWKISLSLDSRRRPLHFLEITFRIRIRMGARVRVWNWVRDLISGHLSRINPKRKGASFFFFFFFFPAPSLDRASRGSYGRGGATATPRRQGGVFSVPEELPDYRVLAVEPMACCGGPEARKARDTSPVPPPISLCSLLPFWIISSPS